MGTNGPELNAAQRAIVQQAIDAHNQKYATDAKMQIDNEDIFSIAKNKDGVITVRIDAYGFNGNEIVKDADGQFDLELRFKDETFDTDKDYSFQTVADSSDNIQEMVNEYNKNKEIENRKEVRFTGADDERLTNIQDINTRFNTFLGKDAVKVNAADPNGVNAPNVSLADIDASLENLETLLEKIEDMSWRDFGDDDTFLTQDQKDKLNMGGQRKTDAKKIKKDLIESLEQAISDLKEMRKEHTKAKNKAITDNDDLMGRMEALGINPAKRIALLKDKKSVEEAFGDAGKDYQASEIVDFEDKYAMPEPEYPYDNMQFGPSADSSEPQLPPALMTDVSKNLTLVAVQNAIEKYNDGKKEDEQIPSGDLFNGQVTIDLKTGDILIGLNDKYIPSNDMGDQWVHDGRYDYRIPGFYNPRSGVLNTNFDALNLEPYGTASTAGVEGLKESLNLDLTNWKNASSREKADYKDRVVDTVAKLLAAQVDASEITTILDAAGFTLDLSKVKY